MENALLPRTTGVRVGDGLPGDEGWIVQNTETVYNIYRALLDGDPVTHKYVHVDGEGLTHRFFEAPVGTPATALLEEAGIGADTDSGLPEDVTVIQGGPGWGIEIERDIEDVNVNKSTNGLIVFDADVVQEQTKGEDRVDIQDAYDWTDEPHETEPRPYRPDTVRLPLITNRAYEGFVQRSVPTVSAGDRVSTGDPIAQQGSGGPSIASHASVDGTVTEVTDTHVAIERE